MNVRKCLVDGFTFLMYVQYYREFNLVEKKLRT